MAREIKFRAWNLTTAQMEAVESLDFNSGNANRLDQVNTDSDRILWPSKECHLMQYTGLKDKNGVEIYEGDYIKYHNDVGNTVTTLDRIVEFKNGSFGIRNSNNYKVIGNIYENPELLSA